MAVDKVSLIISIIAIIIVFFVTILYFILGGRKGKTGAQGLQGTQGSQGPSGGIQGTQGFQGFQGYQGYQGIQGYSPTPLKNDFVTTPVYLTFSGNTADLPVAPNFFYIYRSTDGGFSDFTIRLYRPPDTMKVGDSFYVSIIKLQNNKKVTFVSDDFQMITSDVSGSPPTGKLNFFIQGADGRGTVVNFSLISINGTEALVLGANDSPVN